MQNMKEQAGNIVDKISNTFQKVKTNLTPIDKRDYEFNARQAWLGTTYGKEKCLVTVEEQIEKKRAAIRAQIESRYQRGTTSDHCLDPDTDYYLITTIERHLQSHAEEIMKPFEELGFKVVNLSALTPVLKNTTVYLISWQDAYDEDVQPITQQEQLLCD